MVPGQCPAPEPAPAAVSQLTLENWQRPLQQALLLEADRGFADLQGRRETFSAFLSRELQQAPQPLAAHQRAALVELAEAFRQYPAQTLARRQSLVRRCRQLLHELQRAARPSSPPAPPRLRLLPDPDPTLADSPAAGATAGPAIRPETPLAEVRGIGAKAASRLAALDLWLAEDLLRHYPRDYLDYANLVRIAALEPGRTATIVATVRRSHSFTSPRNPNLSILELQLADVTGRLKVSKFFAGKRFSSPGWLKAQQRQYPVGASIAVSGLVKETPYGPVFQDPLMEVLASPNAPIQSEQIGRLLPVYGLTEGLTADRLRHLIRPLLMAARRWPDHLPEALRLREGLPALGEALWQIHRPSDQGSLASARHRLVFDEFLLLQLGLLERRRELTSRPAPALQPAAPAGPGRLGAFLELLPFPLTGAQRRVLAEIREDLARDQPMARLVQGDVGSGKTVVA
ncbi:MAG: ATP-dependent helicase RecG, partial [Cyanobacteriota bacterium]